MNRFSGKTSSILKNYVYALIDPTNEEIFYIGKGSTPARPFSHLKNKVVDDEEGLHNRIRSIRAQGFEPIVDVVRYGLSKAAAHEVESAVIDAIGLSNLTNSIRGHQTERGRTRADELDQQLGGKPLNVEDINISAILFYCHQAYPKYNLYDSTRQFWNLSKNKIKRNDGGGLVYPYAFAMQGSTVLNIYKILEWYPAGTTYSSRQFRKDAKVRWEFIGSLAEEKILKKYKNKVLHRSGGIMHAPQGGVRYLE